MSSSGMSAAAAWQVILFLVVPLLASYVGLLVWSLRHDREKR
jgi:hypothetical protein